MIDGRLMRSPPVAPHLDTGQVGGPGTVVCGVQCSMDDPLPETLSLLSHNPSDFDSEAEERKELGHDIIATRSASDMISYAARRNYTKLK